MKIKTIIAMTIFTLCQSIFAQEKVKVAMNAYQIDSNFINWDENRNITNEFLGPLPYDYNSFVYALNKDVSFDLVVLSEKNAILFLYDKTGVWKIDVSIKYREYSQYYEARLLDCTLKEYIQKECIDSLNAKQTKILSVINTSDFGQIGQYICFSFMPEWTRVYVVKDTKSGAVVSGNSIKECKDKLENGYTSDVIHGPKRKVGMIAYVITN